MASSRVVIASLAFLLLTLCLVESRQMLEINASEVSKAGGIDCGSTCLTRCQQSSRPNLCKRACGTCCSRCSCVPLGTYGNYDSCPCYRDMTTKGGERKCP
ncbi:gibberellin-regulated protein 1-like [Carex rostrata]